MNITSVVMLIACFGAAGVIFSMGKEDRLYYWAGGFFGAVGVYYLVKMLTGETFFKPWMDIVFRGAAVCFLIVLCYFYFKERNGGEK